MLFPVQCGTGGPRHKNVCALCFSNDDFHDIPLLDLLIKDINEIDKEQSSPLTKFSKVSTRTISDFITMVLQWTSEQYLKYLEFCQLQLLQLILIQCTYLAEELINSGRCFMVASAHLRKVQWSPAPNPFKSFKLWTTELSLWFQEWVSSHELDKCPC